jgi:hypothetical protein
VKKDAPGEADEGGLNQECKWRMGKGEVAIGHLPLGHTNCTIEDITQVPQDHQMRVLPKDHARGGQKQPGRGD